MGAPGLSARVANGLCDPRQGYVGASWATCGRGREGLSSILKRLEWHLGQGEYGRLSRSSSASICEGASTREQGPAAAIAATCRASGART
jgi:hypothetical protein